ncbi:IPT/TIG domain-containing protein [Tieghemostelium lacteum]|uniref:IPT/TIG domain-containing protein n=1 Tax=Tieghemostelium lacteum TaxID=361077 RepID=A0A151ZIK6_TIELA|nr:IPT/TIG domain-containing protein [Tieghemostelium lacteum]|eukprot:KYQ93831.1 IPT/TIG domain-containing protein [Tieghemostelium lacteum]
MIKQIYIYLFICISFSITFIISQSVTNIGPNPNTISNLTFKVTYSGGLVNLKNLTTDISQNLYIPQETYRDQSNIIYSITLNENSQTETYRFHFENGFIKEFLMDLKIKFNFKVVSKPSFSNNNTITLSGLYFQPYNSNFSDNDLYIKAITSEVTKTFSTSNETIKFINSTHFTFQMDNLAGLIDLELKEGGEYRSSLNTSFENPKITKIEYSQASTSQSFITIFGEDFRDVKYKVNSLITVGGSTIFQSSYIFYNESMIIFKFINTLTKSFDIDISVKGVKSIQPFKLQFKPKVTQINSLPELGGIVTIKGFFLNSKSDNGTNTNLLVKIGTKTCTSPTSTSADNYITLICNLESGVGSDLPVVVSIDGISSVDSPNFSYYRSPTLGSIYIGGSGNLTEHPFMNISGYDLTSGNDNITVYLDSKSLKVISKSNEYLIVELPINSQSGNITVFKGLASSSITFTIKPIIRKLSGFIETQGGELSIHGAFFHNNDKPLIIINDNIDCKLKSINLAGDIISCDLSNGTGKDLIIDMRLNNSIISNPNDIKFSYQSPTINSIVHNFDNSITIVGSSHGLPSTINIINYPLQCYDPKVINFTTTICKLISSLPNDTLEYEIQLNVNGLIVNGTFLRYLIPPEYIVKNGISRSSLIIAIVVPTVSLIIGLLIFALLFRFQRMKNIKSSIKNSFSNTKKKIEFAFQ